MKESNEDAWKRCQITTLSGLTLKGLAENFIFCAAFLVIFCLAESMILCVEELGAQPN